MLLGVLFWFLGTGVVQIKRKARGGFKTCNIEVGKNGVDVGMQGWQVGGKFVKHT